MTKPKLLKGQPVRPGPEESAIFLRYQKDAAWVLFNGKLKTVPTKQIERFNGDPETVQD